MVHGCDVIMPNLYITEQNDSNNHTVMIIYNFVGIVIGKKEKIF